MVNGQQILDNWLLHHVLALVTSNFLPIPREFYNLIKMSFYDNTFVFPKTLPNIIHFLPISGNVPLLFCLKSQPSILQFVYPKLLTQHILC